MDPAPNQSVAAYEHRMRTEADRLRESAGKYDDLAGHPDGERSTLRALIKTYLLHNGWRNDFSWHCEDPDAYWYHPTLGVRDFETAVVWQMNREGAYGARAVGWRDVQVPIPVPA